MDTDTQYTPSQLAEKLHISVPTLRKYSLLIEEAANDPHYFPRNHQNVRAYSEQNLTDIQNLVEYSKEHNLTLQKAAVKIFSDHKPSSTTNLDPQTDQVPVPELVDQMNQLQGVLSKVQAQIGQLFARIDQLEQGENTEAASVDPELIPVEERDDSEADQQTKPEVISDEAAEDAEIEDSDEVDQADEIEGDTFDSESEQDSEEVDSEKVDEIESDAPETGDDEIVENSEAAETESETPVDSENTTSAEKADADNDAEEPVASESEPVESESALKFTEPTVGNDSASTAEETHHLVFEDEKVADSDEKESETVTVDSEETDSEKPDDKKRSWWKKMLSK
ncbi:hypothetical protein ACFQ4L_02350 [Lapidilactobacillus mulanensis]|uniref:HTH merR-type domain-containing protein n=1 Tax=Lapidilactobacillus mulanensis TaxID=2485999 RepID=A0ABW4DM15_9LACO|nr:hypothetical protein [Lapidilactobacillus mulanensis]